MPLTEVFSLENLPSCEATHTQSWQIFRVGKNLGKIGKTLGVLALATDFSVKFLLKSFSIRSVGKLRPQSYYSGHSRSYQESEAIHSGHSSRGTLKNYLRRNWSIFVRYNNPQTSNTPVGIAQPPISRDFSIK